MSTMKTVAAAFSTSDNVVDRAIAKMPARSVTADVATYHCCFLANLSSSCRAARSALFVDRSFHPSRRITPAGAITSGIIPIGPWSSRLPPLQAIEHRQRLLLLRSLPPVFLAQTRQAVPNDLILSQGDPPPIEFADEAFKYAPGVGLDLPALPVEVAEIENALAGYERGAMSVRRKPPTCPLVAAMDARYLPARLFSTPASDRLSVRIMGGGSPSHTLLRALAISPIR